MNDACQFCKGTKGGEPGNENLYYGIICCDYCSVLVDTILTESGATIGHVWWAKEQRKKCAHYYRDEVCIRCGEDY